MYKCEYCSKTFKKESTLAVHLCEQKRRHMQKDEKHVQLGFRGYQLFYKIGTNAKNEKSYAEFAKSQYYIGFCKYGYYCRDIGIDDVPAYTTWLLKNQVRLDHWCRDKHFAAWMKERQNSESCDRGVERTVLFLQKWAEENNTTYNTYFHTIAPALAVFHICSGKISPWVLFTSTAAQDLIDNMSNEQLKMITDYLDVDYWQRRMNVNPQDGKFVSEIMEQMGI
jgi:hypothetical protein|tara:strand:+ start:701 stop:1372 length:672 start_codon:yes stop_codon:yes gene_type:complete